MDKRYNVCAWRSIVPNLSSVLAKGLVEGKKRQIKSKDLIINHFARNTQKRNTQKRKTLFAKGYQIDLTLPESKG